MKNIITLLVLAFIVLIPLNIKANPCYSYHTCGSCSIFFKQYDTHWEYSLACGNEPMQFYAGGGDFEGSFCFGQTPCSL